MCGLYPCPPARVAAELGEDVWRQGDAWFDAAATAVLSIPSVVVPYERNFVLNSSHDDFSRLTIRRPEPFTFDSRMRKR